MEDNLSHAISKLPYYCSSEQKRSENRKCKRPLICEKEVKKVCPSLHAVAKIAKNWRNRSFC